MERLEVDVEGANDGVGGEKAGGRWQVEVENNGAKTKGKEALIGHLAEMLIDAITKNRCYWAPKVILAR